jgi:predicted nucleotidyltransferase component of viral defense system
MKDFFEKLNAVGKPKRPDIIEKDFHLYRLLSQISKNEHLVNNLVFKGGTCLIKGYTGYYRFSEDIYFTWKDQQSWQLNKPTITRRKCSTEITRLIKIFKILSDSLGLDFKGDKSDPTEIHISSGGRMVIFFIGYQSLIENLPGKIKVEINFVENIQLPLLEKELVSYMGTIDSEKIKFLYEKLWKEYSVPLSLTCYDPKEIYLEKCRALMTRKVYKLRDSIDVYF